MSEPGIFIVECPCCDGKIDLHFILGWRAGDPLEAEHKCPCGARLTVGWFLKKPKLLDGPKDGEGGLT